MELSDPGSSHAIDRRKSGRAVKKPDFFQEDASTHSNSSAKRKRADRAEGEEDMGHDASGEDSVDDSDGEADEEELKEKRRRAPKAKKVQNKPAAKKPKTVNGMGKLAIRPAPNGVKKAARPKKQTRVRQSAVEDADGLYGVLI